MTSADRGDAPGLGALAQHTEARTALPEPEGWWAEVNNLDLAVYAAIAATPTPTLDGFFRGLSRAANNSKLWITSAAVLATIGGPGGRRAAVNGLTSVAVTSAVVNLVLKPLGRRHRPDRATHHVPITRQVTMPRTTSFPSGHAASASAFRHRRGQCGTPRPGSPSAPPPRSSPTRESTRASTTPSM